MRNGDASLPIDDVLEQISSILNRDNRLVVSAPPGAGKTTRVPLRLLREDWSKGTRMILIQPRRIAARAAAERMAQALGERVGQTVGLRTRLDVRVSNATRIEVVTDGVFTRQILFDPGLEGVSCVLFDEFHERSLEADEGMAFALDAQEVLRPDLRLIVMSATLPEGIGQSYFPAQTIESDGRIHEVETRYLGWTRNEPIDRQMANAIRRALKEETGSILAFMPGSSEIRRTIDHLGALPPDIIAAPLHGALSPTEQAAAISPPPPGKRKVVVSTDLAESALTIEGVRVVIDAGFARRPRFDPMISATRLETIRVAKANADQRRGRAGRTEPGVCYRLWREAEMGGFTESPPPEIENADLSSLCLDLLKWGARSADDLQWLTPPRPANLQSAVTSLEQLGAVNEIGELTPLGSRLSSLPLPPTLAALVLSAPEGQPADEAALAAAILSERDLGGRSTDLRQRIENLKTARTPREHQMRKLAERWAQQGGSQQRGATNLAELLARAMPGRIARARPQAPGRYLMASGRGAFLETTDPLCRHEWLVVADLVGGGADLRITLASPLAADALPGLGAIVGRDEASFDLQSRRVLARRRSSIGAIELENLPIPRPHPSVIHGAVVEAILTHGFGVLPNGDAILAIANRVECLNQAMGAPWPEGFGALLQSNPAAWLPASEGDASRLDYPVKPLSDAALSMLDWPLMRDLDVLAPTSWTTPAGNTVTIDYSAPQMPTVACPMQQVFGLQSHPTIANDRLPLTLHLLSPAGRPVAVTREITSFWTGGYADARKDMKARYPKHFWPERPAEERPSVRTTQPRGQI